jgi:PHD/YefM family antitoxin component YafN of YafNO toxin-antitoxin module
MHCSFETAPACRLFVASFQNGKDLFVLIKKKMYRYLSALDTVHRLPSVLSSFRKLRNRQNSAEKENTSWDWALQGKGWCLNDAGGFYSWGLPQLFQEFP